MKALLEFTLPEEKEEYITAVNGGAYKSILSSLDNELRNKVKYGSDSLTKEEEQAYRLVRQRIADLLLEENLEL
jgi:hypothetical protein